METSVISSAVAHLKNLWMTWIAALFLPLPVLMVSNPAESSNIACCYLGIASAWLASEIFRAGGLPDSRSEWSAKTLATFIALVPNVALFIFMGASIDIDSGIPFPLVAILSAIPAIGVVPWLITRVRQQYAALFFAALVVGSAKMIGCVVARIVYGPNFLADGYIAGDWRTAKLMISTFWALNIAMALGLLFAGYMRTWPITGRKETAPIANETR